MPVDNNDIKINISPNPIRGVIGKNTQVTLSFTNTNLTETAYNLHVKLFIPDGVNFKIASEEPDKSILNDDYSITEIWNDIKDLAPGETYKISVTLQGSNKFRKPNKGTVSFNKPLNGVVLNAIVDTLFNVNEDDENIQIDKNITTQFIPIPYDIEINAPTKVPKGAGSFSPREIKPRWKYKYEIKLDNNNVKESNVSLSMELKNGIRYLGIVSVTGTDSEVFKDPIVNNFSEKNNSTILKWDNLDLSKGATNIIIVEAAIWDKYSENGEVNSGEDIPHNSIMKSIVNLAGPEGNIQKFAKVKAKYFIIEKNIVNPISDVDKENQYLLSYKVNQYTDIISNAEEGEFQIIDTIADGEKYNYNADFEATDLINNFDGTTTILWDIPTIFKEDGAKAGIHKSILYSTKTKETYINGVSVKAFDNFNSTVVLKASIIGNNQDLVDSSNTRFSIKVPTINKKLVNYYYKDGNIKKLQVGAPGDLAEFVINYNSNNVKAEQQKVVIRDLLGDNFEKTIFDMTYKDTFRKKEPKVKNINVNEVRWQLGDIPGNKQWSVKFKVPISGGKDTICNLVKQVGKSNFNKYYTSKAITKVKIGSPELILNKNVTGNNINNIKSGEIYTYTISITNAQNTFNTVTDAFSMTLTDDIPSGLTYKNGSISVSGTGSTKTPIIKGQSLILPINKIAPNEKVIVTYEVIVNDNIFAGATFENTTILTTPYAQSDKSYQYSLKSLSTTAILKTEPRLQLVALTTPSCAKVGEEVQYILQVIVPQGIKISHIQLTDKFPSLTQQFIEGSATKDGVTMEEQPDLVDQTLKFPTIESIDTTEKSVIMTYSFTVKIIDEKYSVNFIDMQSNNAVLTWKDDSTGKMGIPLKANNNISIKRPNLEIKKYQSNITKNILYTSKPVKFDGGDLLSYKINVTNTGKAIAYSNVITDTISDKFNIDESSVRISKGDISFNDNKLSWTIDEIEIDETITLTFNITTKNSLPINLVINNKAFMTYKSNMESEKIYGPIESNEVIFNLINMEFNKVASVNRVRIGDEIKYTLTLNVGRGTIIYNPLIYDVIPNSQQYIEGSALKQINLGQSQKITPKITVGENSTNIKFPQPIMGTDNNIDASNGAIQVIYEFRTKVLSALESYPYREEQISNGYFQWDNSDDNSIEIEERKISIVVNIPKLVILKEQKNFTTSGKNSGFTRGSILANRADIIYYRISVESKGACPAYDISIQDVLDTSVEFLNDVVIPTDGTAIHSSKIVGGEVVWNIPVLNEGERATYIFAVRINNWAKLNDQFSNSIMGSYRSIPNIGREYNENSNVVQTILGGASVVEISTPRVVNLGDEVNYSITVIIPKGTIIYNLEVSNKLDKGQEYIPNSWFSDYGMQGTPIIINNTDIVYKDINNPIVSPTDSDLIIHYNFKAKVVSLNSYILSYEIQNSICNVTWSSIDGGVKVTPIVAKESIKVKRPNLQCRIRQRNITKGQTCFSNELLKNVSAKDIIEYELSIKNIGTAPAYNVISEDVFNNILDLIDDDNSQLLIENHKVTWKVPESIQPGEVSNIIIKVKVSDSFIKETNVINKFSTKYESGTQCPISMQEVTSNEVGFQFINVIVEQYIMQNGIDKTEASAIVGDKINYKIILTIPKGIIAYDVYVKEILDEKQSYVPNTLKSIGGQTTISDVTPVLELPNEGDIDARKEEKTIIYTFQAIVQKIDEDVQEIQESAAFVNWKIHKESGAPKGTHTKIKTALYVTSLKTIVEKWQSLDNTNFVKTKLQLDLGQILYSKLVITNPNHNKNLYNIKVVDYLPKGYKIETIEFIQCNSDIIVGNDVLGSNKFDITISTLAENSKCTIVFSSILVGPIVPGKELTDFANIIYSIEQNSKQQRYGPINSNKINSMLQGKNIHFNKYSSIISALVGEVIQYTLNIQVPQGIVLYGAQVEDILPKQQIYLDGASLNGEFIEINQIGQKLSFPQIPIIDATRESINLNYVFNAKIIDVVEYSLNQENNAWFTWHVEENDLKELKITSKASITTEKANISFKMLQRKQGEESIFDNADINVVPGEFIEYEFVLQNSSNIPAYNIITEDVLGKLNTFSKVVFSDIGYVGFDEKDNKVKWTIDKLPANHIAKLIFEVEVLNGPIAGASETNVATTYFSSTPNEAMLQGPISQSLIHKYSQIKIEQTLKELNYVVGATIKYFIIVTIPRGTKIFNLAIEDILPVEQKYVSSSLNDVPISPHVLGQYIQLPIISEGEIKNTSLVYKYEIDAIIEKVNNNNEFVTVQKNSVNINWSLDKEGKENIGPVSSTIKINVINNSLKIERFQRKLEPKSEFTKNPLTVHRGDVIEYKTVITNKGESAVYSPVIESVISNGTKYLKNVNKTLANVNLPEKSEEVNKRVGLTCNKTSQLVTANNNAPLERGESIEHVYQVRVTGNQKDKIPAISTGSFAVFDGGPRFNTLKSNNLVLQALGGLYSFVPSENSYLTDTQALSYGILGCKGKVGYILESNYTDPTSFSLKIDPIPFPYQLFINGMFIEEVQSNTVYNDMPELLSGLLNNSITNIELLYSIPSWYKITNKAIKFNITTNLTLATDPITISSQINLGQIELTTAYTVNEYSPNPKLFAIDYTVNLNISSNIQMYDVELQCFYPPSCIFKNAYKNGVEVPVTKLSGQIVYPTIELINTVNSPMEVKYNYTVLQYKKTPLSVGALEQNNTILSIRASRNLENKCVFESSTLKTNNEEELTCVYVDKVFGKCVQYYGYKNISIPPIEGYVFKEVVFDDPQIISGSLSITTNDCEKNFSSVKYSFIIPYTIIYVQYNCSVVETKEIKGQLEQKDLQVALYTPENEGNVYDIIPQTIVKSVTNNTSTTFCACIGVVTSSIGKVMVLVNNLGKCNFIYCCPSCDPSNKPNY